MRKKLCWVLAGTMLLSAVIFGGCGTKKEKLTAESILEQVNENMDNIQSVSGNMAMNVDMKISESGLGMNLSMGMDCDLEMTMEPEIVHMAGKLNLSLLGLSMDMESYTVTEGDKKTNYTKMNNAWEKSEEDAEDVAGVGELFDELSSASELTLQKETEKIDDKEVYVLTAGVSGESLNSFMGSVESMAEDAGELDLSGVEADVTLRVYKDEMLPAAVSVEISDAGSVVESDGTKMEIHSLSLELNYSEFDTIESIEIPEEALNSEVSLEQKLEDVQEAVSNSNGGDNADNLVRLQEIYGKAPEYEHMGIGYYFDGLEEDTIRDGYVPYEDNFVQRDMGSLTGVNHGVSIRLSMMRANSATEALAGLLEDYTKRLADKGLSILDSDTPSAYEDDTVGLLPVVYLNEEGRQIFTILYADIRDDGTVYMCAEMEFDENGFDDTTEALLAEIDDAYALNLSSIFIEG
ncbi:DUF6612 family protein [Frisingicoccus sp.]|uniref:DUF6612 family protein n=1 Tax=Frisingicoccus sp. TaxID=1918627 RepID=UPI003AB552F2